MTDIKQLMSQYIAEYGAGGDANPLAYLDRVPDREERATLAVQIDEYLTNAPRQPFNASAFAGSLSERVADDLEKALGGQSGLWPSLLPRIRARAGIKRSSLVEQLASTLGFSDRLEKIASYYDEMEQGLLPSSGVSDRVLDALGKIVGETQEALREAGQGAPGFGGTARRSGITAFARSRYQSAEGPVNPGTSARRTAEWDEVDELFCGASGRAFDPPALAEGRPPRPEPGPRPTVIRPETASVPGTHPSLGLDAAGVHFARPKHFNDVQELAEKFKASIPVIMDLRKADSDLAKRLTDFASGLTFGLNGGMERIANQVFLLTPAGVDVSREELAQSLEDHVSRR